MDTGEVVALVTVDGFTGRLDYPMLVVTAATDDGTPKGCLVGFASQCSLSPARFAVWLSRANHTYEVARRAEFLGVHLLRRDEHHLARRFGGACGARVDKFAGVRWQPGTGGAPVLTDSCSWWVGRVERYADWGDHVGFHLTPVKTGGDGSAHEKLLRLSDVTDLDPGHPG
ncbi:flavin reductase family protein [Streptomyces sp. NPDC046925]|uniref:flavin reductase family protein n=1 Tax=Streptomyces sp. NPDC046925 TaxID=3155375 RepID=UPI0033C152F0